MRRSLALTLAVAGLTALASAAPAASVFSPVKSNAKLGKQGDDLYLLPTSQLLHPWGEQTLVRGRPVDLAFDAAQ